MTDHPKRVSVISDEISPKTSNSRMKVIIYNRITKAGSLSFATLLARFAKAKKQFRYLASAARLPYRLNTDEQKQLRNRLIKTVPKSAAHRLIYGRHMHFAEFQPNDRITFHYMNMFRDPADRAISHYNYQRVLCIRKRKKPGRNCTNADNSITKYTLDQCMSKMDPSDCLSKFYGVRSVVSFFCGHDPICDDSEKPPNSEAAIALAKSNIEKHYLVIGMLDHFNESLNVFEHVAPEMFTGLTSYYQEFGSEISRHRTPKKYVSNPSKNTRELVKKLLQPEYELYNFVQQRLSEQYRRYTGNSFSTVQENRDS